VYNRLLVRAIEGVLFLEAIVINHYGDAKQFETATLPVPEVGAHELQIAMHATAINPFDCQLRQGRHQESYPFHFPITLGSDFAGVVQAVGTDVTAFKVGDAVMGTLPPTREGTYAEVLTTHGKTIIHKPAQLSFTTAAALPLAGITALQALRDHLKLQAGEHILINAAAGGVGHLAVQLAAQTGAIIAVTGSPDRTDFLKQLGATTVIDYHDTRLADVIHDYDAALDLAASADLDELAACLKSGGRIMSLTKPLPETWLQQNQLTGRQIWSKPNATDLATVTDLVANGNLTVTVSRTLPFSELGLNIAHRLSEAGHTQGKLVVQMIAD
jgi:NADPH:quinone reductase-like Zn-dependent oxidoreductase